jgi:myo-inositol-1-phosphate synthase
MNEHRRIGLWLIGAFGGVGTTAALGLAALRRGLMDTTSLVTALPLFDGLDLDGPAEFVVGGHDIRRTSYRQSVSDFQKRANVFDRDLTDACLPDLDAWGQNVRPGTVLNTGPTISKLADLPEAHRFRDPRAAVEQIQNDLRQFRETQQLDQVVVINVASTEPPFPLKEVHQSLERLLKPQGCQHEGAILPASSLYAWAAVDLGLPYVNFTPSLGASFPAIQELALQRGVPLAGQDGKTGETLLKTVLAPMFAQRNLHVLSWVGHNIFGNRDGIVLDDPANKASKIQTKDKVVSSVLGYKPQTLVSIEYIESLDDWKTAWDHIHFRGFLGVKMMMQFTWQGCDSILAAPLVLDLARLALLAQRRGEAGVLRHLACFFKSPMGVEEHDFFKQFGMLEEYVQERRGGGGGAGGRRAARPPPPPHTTPPAAQRIAMKLAFSTNAYLKYSFAEAVRRLAAIGYAGVEIMADVPHAWPACLLEEQKQQIRDALSRHHLGIANVNAFMMNAISDARQQYWHPSWIEPDRHYRQIRIAHTKRALTLARELGAPCITTEPGGPVPAGESWSAALHLFVEMLKPVADHAEKEGVLLLVEPEPGLLIEKAEQFEEFMQHIACPAVGLNFDIGHFYCVGDDPAGTVPRLAKWTRHYHLEDIAATRVHHHLVPGEGAIDFAGTLRAIRATGYDGWITIELYPYVDDPDSAARTALERVGKVLAQT